MKTEYYNRYGDNITFKEVNDKTVVMTGHDSTHTRLSCGKDYSEAYYVYSLQCLGLEEPDMMLLYEAPEEDVIRTMTFQEFVHTFEESSKSKDKNFYWKYSKYIKLDKNTIQFVDPPGGPYLFLGMDLGRYFKDNVIRSVEDIVIKSDKVVFTIKKYKNEKVATNRAHRTKRK